MAGKLGRFQSRTMEGWMGTTKENNLGQAFLLEQQKLADVMVRILAWRRGKSMESMLAKYPTKYFANDEEFYWDVIGSAKKNVPLVEARKADYSVVGPTDTAGANMQVFYLVFAEDYFADGETIVGNLENVYQFRILGNSRQEGSNYVYKVEMTGGNTTGCPGERLQPGERFSVGAAFVEKSFSRKVGDVRFTTPTQMRSEWSTIRLQHKEGGSMLNKKLATAIPFVDDKTGKTVLQEYWMHYVNYECEAQFSDYKNWALAYGRSNRTDTGEYLNIGKSGEVIKTGAGLFELMENGGNVEYYNKFSLKALTNKLYQLSADKIEPGKRNFIIKTGMYGALQFHEECLKTYNGWQVFKADGDAIGAVKKANNPVTGATQGLAFGFQFVEYLAPNGVRVTLDIDNSYDDTTTHKIMHPKGGPAFSYRYDIIYAGDSEEGNIYKCEIEGGSETRGYQWGPFRNPFTGQKGNPNASFDEDAAVFHIMGSFGIMLLDPTKVVSMIPAILMD